MEGERTSSCPTWATAPATQVQSTQDTHPREPLSSSAQVTPQCLLVEAGKAAVGQGEPLLALQAVTQQSRTFCPPAPFTLVIPRRL